MGKLTACRPDLLYLGKGHTPSAHCHHHLFYQLEYCLTGPMSAKLADKQLLMQTGDYCLIPPGTEHDFGTRGQHYDYISLKFTTSIQLQLCYGHDSLPAFFLQKIAGMLEPQSTAPSPFSQEGKTIIETLLFGVLDYLHDHSRPARTESRFLSVIREAVYKHGYQTNVATLVDLFGYSRSQFYKLFKAECPQETSAKKLIEDILLELIQQQLQYSNTSITDIAKAMNFNNIFLFSRFYKRKTGQSPRQARHDFAHAHEKTQP